MAYNNVALNVLIEMKKRPHQLSAGHHNKTNSSRNKQQLLLISYILAYIGQYKLFLISSIM